MDLESCNYLFINAFSACLDSLKAFLSHLLNYVFCWVKLMQKATGLVSKHKESASESVFYIKVLQR